MIKFPPRRLRGQKERIAMTLERAKQKTLDTCNLIGEDVDIYKVMYRYKAIRELDPESIDQIYDEMAEALGFTK